jgi:twitching motility two-component system response regulator PilH
MSVMAIKKILVVDDSKTELMFLTDLLVKNGFTVKTAENAEDAFRRLAEDKPEPIIMCTSKNQETDRVWGMRQGARDYITKPVNTSELMAKIKALG